MHEEYKKLRSRHQLPKYDELDHVFEISAITSHSFLLREIRRHIVERLRNNAEILEDIIHPNSTVSAFHECRFFNEQEKKGLYDLYAKIMKHIRRSNLLDVKLDEDLDAQFINDISGSWPELQSGLHDILEKLHFTWSEEEIGETPVTSYFG